MKNIFILYTTLILISTTAFGQTLPDTVVDIDSNVYHTIQIGSQIWMVENLKVTHYRNGDLIPSMTNSKLWSDLTSGAYCDYDNKPPNSKIYGRLYNYYAVSDKRNIAPAGWHVPTEVEWETLETTLGLIPQTSSDSFGLRGTIEGGKLKETDTTHWTNPNSSATNSSGYTALPGGYRNYDGLFIGIRTCGSWWTSTEENPVYDPKADPKFQHMTFYRMLFNNNSKILRYLGFQVSGYSIRCIKDSEEIEK